MRHGTATTEARRASTDDEKPHTDVRLAIAAGAAWLVLAVSLGTSVLALLVRAVASLVVAVAALAVRSAAIRRWAPVVAAAGFATALVLLPFAARLWQAHDSPLQQLANEHASVRMDLRTTGDPRVIAATGVAGAVRVAIDTEARTVIDGARGWQVSGPVLVLAPAQGWSDLLPGQPLRVSGSLQPSLDSGSTGATLFVNTAPELTGTPPWYQRAAGTVRDDLREAASVLPTQERGLLPGLVDGDTSRLDPVLADRFKIAGLTHLVAVSGLNAQ